MFKSIQSYFKKKKYPKEQLNEWVIYSLNKAKNRRLASQLKCRRMRGEESIFLIKSDVRGNLL